MEIAFKDDGGGYARFHQKDFEFHSWYSPNHPINIISDDAHKLSNATSFSEYNDATGDDGELLTIEWAEQPDWYDHGKPWRAYIPVQRTVIPIEGLQRDWYQNLRRPAPYIPYGDKYKLDPEWTTHACKDLETWYGYVESITFTYQFDGLSPMPPEFDRFRLQDAFFSVLESRVVAGQAKRAALDYLGFISEWILTVVNWEDGMDSPDVEAIRNLELEKTEKRGVLFSPTRDFHEVDIAGWVRNKVPVFYLWDACCKLSPRLSRLRPVAHELLWEKADESGDFSTSIKDFLGWKRDYFEGVLDFDIFFQKRVHLYSGEGKLPDNAVETWHWSVIDFEGWRRRDLSYVEDKEALANRYHYTLFEGEEGEQHVLFWRWRPRITGFDDDQEIVGYDPPEGEEALRSIRTRFRGGYAPKPGEVFDKETGILKRAAFWGREAWQELDDEISKLNHSPGSRILARNERANLSGRSLDEVSSDSNDVTDFGRTAIQWSSEAHSFRDRSRERRSYDAPRHTYSISPFRHGWRRAVQVGDRAGVFDNRGNSVARHSENESRRAGRSRSASPVRYPPLSRQRFGELRGKFLQSIKGAGSQLVQLTPLWKIPMEYDWNSMLLKHGHIIFEDTRTQVRMRYIANCFEGVRSIRHVLEAALERRLPFSLAVKREDLHHFRPSKIDDLDLQAKNAYADGAYPSIEIGTGGMGLSTRYRHQIQSIIRSPHGQAMISKGGPVSWIACRYGGINLVQRFMTGPSVEVAVHYKGWNDTDSKKSMELYCDSLTNQEIDLIFGHVTEDGRPTNRWLYPNYELLLESCDHWEGEWNASLERMFQRISEEIDRGRPKARSYSEWRKWLRQDNRGRDSARRTGRGIDIDNLHSRMKEAYGDSWHKKACKDIEVPEVFELPSGRN